MKKKILSVLMCAAMVASLAACGLKAPETPAASEAAPAAGSQASGDAVTLVYAEVNPLDTIVGQTATAFKEKVEELSGGQKSMLLSLPYTFVSRDHFWNFATSDLAGEFLAEPSENGSGVRGLFYGEEGFRHFFTVDPVAGIEDMAGLKIRVSNDPVMNALVEGLGATPSVVSFNELYSALQTGVVDAAEQQGWLTEVGEYASQFNRQISEEAENKILEELKADGVNIVEVTDVTPWQEAVKPVIEANVNTDELKTLYQQILDMQ